MYLNFNNYIWIYKLTAPNGKVYVGQSNNFIKRFKSYKYLRCKAQCKLYNSLKKYGWNNFNVEILFCKNELNVDEYERFFISIFDCVNNGLNLQSGGNSNNKHSEESKLKMRKAKLNIKKSEETKQKMRKPKSEEHRRHISESQVGRTPWNKGKKTECIP